MLCLGAAISLQMSGEDEYFCGMTFLWEISLGLTLLLGFSCFPLKEPELPWQGGVGFSMCWCYFHGIMELLPCETPEGGELGGHVPQPAAKGISPGVMVQDAQGLPWLWSGASLHTWGFGKRQFQHGVGASGSSILCFSKHVLRRPTGDVSGFFISVFLSFTAGTAGFLLLQKLPMAWRLQQTLSVWELNQTRHQGYGSWSLWLVPGPSHQTEMSQLQQPLLPAVSSRDCIPGGCTEESKAQHCEKPRQPVGVEGEGKWKNIPNKQIHIPGKTLPKNV